MKSIEVLTWVKRVDSITNPNGRWIDVIELDNGACISIAEDGSIIVWECLQHFLDYEIEEADPDDVDLHNYTYIGTHRTPHLVHESRR